MITKKSFLLLASIALSGISRSQSVMPQVQASCGEHFTGANAMLSWTLGETMIETFNGSNSIITQGFHQTDNLSVGINDILFSDGTINVYPNPNNGMFLLNVPSDCRVNIMNVMGQIVKSYEIKTGISPVDLSNYSNGIYFIHLSNNNALFWSGKIDVVK